MLQEYQFEFLQNVVKLLNRAEELNIKVTLGEAFRPFELHLLYLHGYTVVEKDYSIALEPSKKKAWTKTSKHLKRLAIDFNFFIKNDNREYELTYDIEGLTPLGNYWESLNDKNSWGGFWTNPPDVQHFQMSY